jgi:predicted membrane-bound spermidine synthase
MRYTWCMIASHISRWSLRALVAYTGACVLVVEILATRILAPHFGSSLTTLSSVLGITLGALSIGYYAGGILGERHASWSTLGSILLWSGLTTMCIWPLSALALPLLEAQLPVGVGAIAASLLLFLIPCAILGTLSPYVIAIEESLAPGINAGRAAGNIFFWSTLGSIAGSVAAGFLLIPLLGVRTPRSWMRSNSCWCTIA